MTIKSSWIAATWKVFCYVQLLWRLLQAPCCTKAQLFPAFFILGDSLVDNGNNNFIGSLAVANTPYNGIDFPDHLPTGRFCNGRTVADILASNIGLPPAPPFLDPLTRGAAILKGVNFASGAAGILDATGGNYISRISFNKQLQFFNKTKQSLITLIGKNAANSLLNKSLYYIVIGNNDYINNYLLENSPYKQLTPSQFQNLLISTFSQQLKILYTMGARKIVVSDIGPLGCIPSQINQRSPSGACVQFINDYVRSFNSALKSSLIALNQKLHGAIFSYANSYDGVMALINNPAASGFNVTNVGCCGVGRFNGQVGCTPISNLCPNRKDHLFWDPFHPTEAANLIFAASDFHGNISAISPFNIQQLANIA